MDPARPRSRAAARTIAPLLGGAVAAAAGVMLLGWPHRPQLPGPAGAVAAAALVVVAVLLVFAPAAGPRGPVPGTTRDRRVPTDARTGRGHVPTRADREPTERPARRDAFEPAR